MPNLPISQLSASSALDGTELLVNVQGGVTKKQTVQDTLNADLPITSSGITLSGDIVPSTPQGSTLGSVDRPFAELYLQSGSISIESDTPGDPSAIISNVSGNLEISVGGMLLIESGSSFTSPTGSFDQLSADLQENYIWIGDSNNRNIETPVSSLPGYFPFNYGLFNQTGSSIPVSGSDPTGSLIDGGLGTLSVPANGFNQGDSFRSVMFGRINTAGGGVNLEILIESNGVALADTGVITMPTITDKNWQMDVNFSINKLGGAGTAEIASAGTFTFRTDSAGSVESEIFSSINNTTFDTTIENTLRITAVWSGNAGANDTIYSQIFTLRNIY